MILGVNKIFFFLITLLSLNHPVHVSITNVDFDKNQGIANMSVKVFKDDFQLLFAHLYQIELDLENLERDSISNNRVKSYFSNRIKFLVNDTENLNFKYKSIKKNEESIWFIFEANTNTNKEVYKISIENTILFDLYFDQKNMLIFTCNNKEEGFIFNLNQRKKTILLNDF